MNGDASLEVLQIDYPLLQLLELPGAVVQFTLHLVRFDHVFVTGGANVQDDHTSLYPIDQVDVGIQVNVGPKVNELNLGISRADPVDSAETLNDAYGVPVYVVVDQVVAVLWLLPLADTIRTDQQINFATARRPELIAPLDLGEKFRMISPQLVAAVREIGTVFSCAARDQP